MRVFLDEGELKRLLLQLDHDLDGKFGCIFGSPQALSL